jgi:hypothetical protein
MASSKISPPAYGKEKSYERYKQELLAWREVTDLAKSKQGIVVALSLPENDCSNIREKVFDQLSLSVLKTTTGFDSLVTFLDSHLGKDDLADSLEKFEDFDDYIRENGDSIIEYIEKFDSKYMKIQKKNMVLPPEILAFKLLKKANLTREEKLLVLTGVNYENRGELYSQAQKSLKKFKGEVIVSSPCGIKLEPTIETENEEALWTNGQNRYNGGRNWRGQYRFNGPGIGNGHGNSEGGYGSGVYHIYGRRNGGTCINRGKSQSSNDQRGQRSMVLNQSTADGGNYNVFGQGNRRPINPKTPDGEVMTCRACGSYRHMMADCPHSWENLQNVNIADSQDSEEHVVLFTGYNKDTVSLSQLNVEAHSCAVLDSACSSTVCGKNWIDSYIDSMDDCDRRKIVCRKGTKMFKFGGGTKLKSIAEYELPANLAGKKVTIKTDVVQSDIPMLLSKTAMKKARVKLDLANDKAEILGRVVKLNSTSSGNYCVFIGKQRNVHDVESVCMVEAFSVEKCSEKQTENDQICMVETLSVEKFSENVKFDDVLESACNVCIGDKIENCVDEFMSKHDKIDVSEKYGDQFGNSVIEEGEKFDQFENGEIEQGEKFGDEFENSVVEQGEKLGEKEKLENDVEKSEKLENRYIEKGEKLENGDIEKGEKFCDNFEGGDIEKGEGLGEKFEGGDIKKGERLGEF